MTNKSFIEQELEKLQEKGTRKMKRYYRTYKIKGRGKELLASVQADNEGDAEIEFLDKYYDNNYPNIFWTSPIFESVGKRNRG